MAVAAPIDVEYLTVQDVLWINLQVTRTVNDFAFAKLEESVYQQYSYGDSLDVPGQASRLLKSMIAHNSISKGNTATAAVAYLAFLELNGYKLPVDAHGLQHWARTLARDGKSEATPQAYECHHKPNLRQVVRSIVTRLGDSIAELSEKP